NTMLKKYLTVACIMAGIMFFAAACQTDNNNTEQKDNNTVSEEDNTSGKEPGENDMVLPEEPLQKLDEGKSVQALQKILNELGYDINIGSVYDDDTTWAITDLQLQTDDLLVTGVYNEETRAVIEK